MQRDVEAEVPQQQQRLEEEDPVVGHPALHQILPKKQSTVVCSVCGATMKYTNYDRHAATHMRKELEPHMNRAMMQCMLCGDKLADER